MLPQMAELERMTAEVGIGLLANRVLTDGAERYQAIVDRNVERLGEYGQMVERRDRLTLVAAGAVRPRTGDTLEADPTYYSAAELAAMDKTDWTLEMLESDDGHVMVWWAR